MTKFWSFTFVLLLLMGSAAFGILHLFWWSPNSSVREEVQYELKSGANLQSIAKDLEKLKVIKNAAIFSLICKVKGIGSKLKVGDYVLRKDMFPGEVVEVIISGKSQGKNFTVPEGFNIFEIAASFQEEGFGTQEAFLSAAKDSQKIQELLGQNLQSFEGYLYPDTYQITKYMSAQDLVGRMVHKFLEVKKEFQSEIQNSNLNLHQLVTLASIVEKETGAPFERPMISGVFHNRLKIKMRLQTDPTIIYAKALETGSVEISITKKDLSMQHPYNTYVVSGLPPGPIASPGRLAIKAALQPAKTSYLYFVSKNDGTHIFTETYENHAKEVEKYQLNAKARENKSWRDLKKTLEQTSQK